MEATTMLIYIIVWCAMAYWCYTIAKKNGRSTGLAIFMGLLFSLWAVIVYYAIGKSKVLRDKELEDKIQSRIDAQK